MTQLDEANEIIKELKTATATGTFLHIANKSDGYYDKYLKPKDPLFGRFYKVLNSWGLPEILEKERIDPQDIYCDMAKEFANELSGTRGLDEAIEWAKRECNYNIQERLLKIKWNLKEQNNGIR